MTIHSKLGSSVRRILLPIADQKHVPYRSTVDGCCHGCGHDAHTAILLGAAAEMAQRELPGRVRLIFQPAEESVPGGALAVMSAGALVGVESIFALHCDPRLETGHIGVRVGPITAACDQVDIAFSGPGGHTARPHLTADLVYALGLVVTIAHRGSGGVPRGAAPGRPQGETLLFPVRSLARSLGDRA